MDEMGLSIPNLHEVTRAIDPAGRGVCKALIGFLSTRAASQRETCSPHSAGLLAEGLNRPLGSLFEVEVDAPMESTSTGDGEHEDDGT